MTLGQLIEDLQVLEENYGKWIEVDINIEPDPMSTVNETDAVAHELELYKSKKWIERGNVLSLFFS